MEKGGTWRPGPPSELSSVVEVLATGVNAAPQENHPGLPTQPPEADQTTVSAPGTAPAARRGNPVSLRSQTQTWESPGDSKGASGVTSAPHAPNMHTHVATRHALQVSAWPTLVRKSLETLTRRV